MELGWRNQLYQWVNTVGPTKVGQRWGEVLYHGPLGFTLYGLVGHSISDGIVFETGQGKVFEGLRCQTLGSATAQVPS